MNGAQELVLTVFASLLRALGLRPQPKKVWFEGGFSFTPQMLGVIFHLDADPMYVEVPADKVAKATRAIDRAIRKRWNPADECQELLGILAFHGRILLTGRWHLPFTVRALARACRQGAAPMHALWKEELRWWRELLAHWNRRSILLPRLYTRWHQTPLQVPMTDASRAIDKPSGAGAVFGRFFMQFLFSDREVRELSIMDLEGLVVVLWLRYLCEHHRDAIRGKRFIGKCDNEPFVLDVNARKSTHPQISFLLGSIHHLQSKHGFDFKLEYIKSKDNVAADALSRERRDLYFQHMSDSFSITPDQLVYVPVDNSSRNSLASAMIRLKRSSAFTRTRRE